MAKRGRDNRAREKELAARRANTIRAQANDNYDDDTDYEQYQYSEEYDDDAASRKAGKGCLIVFLVVAALVLGVLLFGWFTIKGEIDGNNATATETVHLVIESGMSKTAIGELLQETGLIGNTTIFRLYTRMVNTKPFYAGSYRLEPGMGYEEIIAIISQEPGERETIDIMFPPGGTLMRFAYIMEENELCTAQEFIDEANNGDFSDIKFFRYLLEDYDVNTFMRGEGYLAPNTYTFFKDDTVHNYVRKLFEQFNEDLESLTFNTESGTVGFYERLEQQNISLREAITLASLVEREASNPDENQAGVAGVFWNRLTKDLPAGDLNRRTLGSDVTIRYLADWVSRAYGSPDLSNLTLAEIHDQLLEVMPPEVFYAYYTGDEDPQTREGLPAGPICNPGLSAIRAALQPELHDYFFFLTDYYGKFYYARTYREHQNNIAIMNQQNAEYEEEQAAGEDESVSGEP